ncbi:HalOD1 output domain-containing protein [Natrinema salaciae]|uniref:Halobacterial output domain-containing protein n=1 Tax=Natrinema salaciae TaxID=1186196 RepID=A0A1H9LWF0_9EURY|nr:HalOD1 output domain-containing protein [Natrinema salaciae]SER15688.1 hypothetical protein SAMN04489841_3110 [Natrinema salaciae]
MSDRIGPIDYDIESNTYRVRYDPTAVAPSVAVTTALEAVIECDPAELTPLYEVIDPDGLDTVLQPSGPMQHRRELTVSFRYRELLVTASGDGLLEIEPIVDGCSSER